MAMMASGRVAARCHLARKADHQPRCDHDCDEERKDHRGGGIDRDRRHVGAHQARDEQHRQQRRDHSHGGHDRGIAHFGNCFDGGFSARALVWHGPVPRDILDHHDRIIDQDADREDQRKQADPVDCVTHQVRGEHGQQDRGGDHHGRHRRLAPTDSEADQHDDRNRREREVIEELVCFLVRGRAVVARDRDIDAIGNEAAFEAFQPLQHRI